MNSLVSMVLAAAAAACMVPAGRGLSTITRERDARSKAPDGDPDGPPRQLDRRPPDSVKRAGDLPMALDLLAVCLAAGAAPGAALAVVAEVVAEPLASDLAVVARALRLGSSSQQAWAVAHADRPAALNRAAARFVHAERSGTALVAALTSLASEERNAVQLARARAARRVGVLAAAPLGVCFLPAFVLVGVLPVVAGLLARLSLS